MKFIAYQNGDRGATAAFLMQLADELDIDQRSIRTTRGGFMVPDELLIVDGVQVLEEPPVPLLAVPDDGPKEPPEGWYDIELPTPDVELDEPTGQVFLTTEAFLHELKHGTVVVEDVTPPVTLGTQESIGPLGDEVRAQNAAYEPESGEEADRETIRAWAKSQGIEVADKGALKRSVLTAFEIAHS